VPRPKTVHKCGAIAIDPYQANSGRNRRPIGMPSSLVYAIETGCTVTGPAARWSATLNKALLNGSTRLPSLLVPSGNRMSASPAASRKAMVSRCCAVLRTWRLMNTERCSCASLPGTDPDGLAVPLSYLYYHHLAPPALRAHAVPERFVDMRRLDPATLDPVGMLAALPPLIKGYLRLGGFVGDGAVIDEQFNTTDVCIVVKTDLVAEKYSRHYERQSKETWAA